MARVRFTDRQIADALERSKGVLVDAARLLGCSRRTIQKRLESKPKLREVREEAEQALLDTGEGNLAMALRLEGVALRRIAQRVAAEEKALQSGKDVPEHVVESAKALARIPALTSTRFVLERKGKARGWGRNIEVSGDPEKPLRVDERPDLANLNDDDLMQWHRLSGDATTTLQ